MKIVPRTDVMVTLEDIINSETRYDQNKIMFYTVTDNGELVIRDTDLFEMYIRFVRQYVIPVMVTPKEARYYQYRPGLLSYDVYGTRDLAWLIIMLNDEECPSKFRLKKIINMIPPEAINTLYDGLVTKSNSRINENWDKYLLRVGEKAQPVAEDPLSKYKIKRER